MLISDLFYLHIHIHTLIYYEQTEMTVMPFMSTNHISNKNRNKYAI